MIMRINSLVKGASGEVTAYGVQQFIRDKNDFENYTLYRKVCDDVIDSDSLMDKVIRLTYESQEYDYLDDVLYITASNTVVDSIDSSKDVSSLLAVSRQPFNHETVKVEIIYKDGVKDTSKELGNLNTNELRDIIDKLVIDGGLG